MRNIFIVILLFIGSVSAQTYQKANIFIEDSIKLGTSTNSVWFDTVKAGSIIITVDGTDFIMDGIPWDIGEPYDSTNFYVDATLGSDANSGTNPDSSLKTLTVAQLRATDPGDTIFAKRGEVFTRDTILEITHSGDATGDIVWDGDSWGTGDKATIQSTLTGGGNPIGRDIVRFVTNHHVTFQNFIIDGNSMNRHGIMIGGNEAWDGPGVQADEDHITVQDCEIKNIGDYTLYENGIMIRTKYTDINNITIKNNHIHDIASHGVSVYSTWLEHGATIGVSVNNTYIGYNTIKDIRLRTAVGFHIQLTYEVDSAIIEHNVCTSGPAVGPWNIVLTPVMETYSGTDYTMVPDNITIRYNTATGNIHGVRMINMESSGIVDHSFEMIRIYGNKIYTSSNGSDGGRVIYINEDAGNWSGSTYEIYNNTLVSQGAALVHIDARGTGIIRNNLMFNNYSISSTKWVMIIPSGFTHTNNLYYQTYAGGDWVNEVGGAGGRTSAEISGWEGTSQVTDPTFTVEFSNLHLQTGSDAIDGGVAISGYTEDIEGVAVGSPPNIGAYETTEN